MAVYVYTARDPGAAAVQGTISAASPREARDRLRAQGLAVREMAERQAAGARGRLERFLTRRQAAKVTPFLQELATLLAAGIPLVQALDTVARQHRAGRFQRAVMLLREHVAAGGGLAEAMGEQPELFDELAQSIVEVGERSGRLEDALHRLVQFRRRAAGLKNRLASALLYPALVLAVGAAVSVFLMTHVVPRLLNVLAETGGGLPLPTLVVKACSDFLLAWGWLLAVAALAIGVAARAALHTERGQRFAHGLQLRAPVVGELARKQGIGRMAEVMAALLQSGLPFVQAAAVTRRTLKNRILRDALEACERAVYAGRDIAGALERTGAFPPVVVQIFAVGQASGKLESMLESLASDYETQVEIAANRLTSVLEPLLLIFLALTVGLIAFATILPIVQAGKVL
jgi:type II secretory pathway component PulF